MYSKVEPSPNTTALAERHVAARVILTQVT